MDTLMNKKSGFLGMTGMSDMRDIEKARAEGNERAKDVYEVFIQRIVKYIGSYYAEIGGLDVLVFAGGIGENDWIVRGDICERLAHLGIEFDHKKNDGSCGKEVIVSKPRSRVTVMVIPTNEELLIAKDAYRLVVTAQ
jgi:acetate kinase